MAREGGGAYHHGNLRQALVDAAWDQVTRDGITALSLRQVARATGVSHSAPQRHFANKEALLAAVAAEGFRRFAAALETAFIATTQDLLGRLHATGQSYVRFALDHPAQYRLMFGGVVPDRSRHPDLDRAAADAAALMRRAVERCQNAGVLRPGDPTPITLTMRSAMHGLATLALDGELAEATRQGADLRVLVESVMATIDVGIAAPRPPAVPAG